MDDDELRGRLAGIGEVARVAPSHKARVVRLLQNTGHLMAITGDGVNDPPALKSADIGVAMGVTGTEVSKEAAAVVLTDDDFPTIVDAVARGRTCYTNIVTFVLVGQQVGAANLDPDHPHGVRARSGTRSGRSHCWRAWSMWARTGAQVARRCVPTPRGRPLPDTSYWSLMPCGYARSATPGLNEGLRST